MVWVLNKSKLQRALYHEYIQKFVDLCAAWAVAVFLRKGIGSSLIGKVFKKNGVCVCNMSVWI
jgi:hypothetical protein